jgi:hypothetical protein
MASRRSATTRELCEWLLKHEGISDTKQAELLCDDAKVQMARGVCFPTTLRGIWNAATGYTGYRDDRVDRVAYCPRSSKTQRRYSWRT